MKLTSAKISRPLKDKKITKPSTYSTRDAYNFFCKNKIKEDDAYFFKKKTLFLDVKKQKLNFYRTVDVKREEYVILCDKLEEKPYDLYLNRLVEEKRAEIQFMASKVEELESSFENIKMVCDFDIFKNIIATFNKKCQDEIIDGKRLNLQNGLGFIEALVVERNNIKKVLDYNETRKRKLKLLAEGVDEKDLYNVAKNPTGTIKYSVFRTDDDWIRLSWKKLGGAKNMSVYEFKPTDSRSRFDGFRNRFSKAVSENPLLKFKYKRVTYTTI